MKDLSKVADDITGMKVDISFLPEHADLSDNEDEGFINGNIISFLYVDDHYRYTVRSDAEEDYVVDDYDLWNQGDRVSVILPKEKFVVKPISGRIR